MTAHGQQDMITISLATKFKLKKSWAYCMARMPHIKESEKIAYEP